MEEEEVIRRLENALRMGSGNFWDPFLIALHCGLLPFSPTPSLQHQCPGINVDVEYNRVGAARKGRRLSRKATLTIAPLPSTMVKVIMPKEWNTARLLSITP